MKRTTAPLHLGGLGTICRAGAGAYVPAGAAGLPQESA